MNSRSFFYWIPIFLQKVGWLLFGAVYKMFFSLEIRGEENLIGLNRPIILASNHTSELDVTAVELTFPFISKLWPIYFVSDPKEKFKTFGWRNYLYGGVFFNLLGGYSVHSGHKNYAISLENHLRLLVKGRTVFIFPEGRRTSDGHLSVARGGLGYMVYVTGATVVPIAINTFYNVTWREFFKRKKKVIITVLKPMYEKDLITKTNPGVEEFRGASQKVLDRIKEVL